MPMMHVAVLAGVFFVLAGYQLPLVSAGVCPYTYYWRNCYKTWCGSVWDLFRCTKCNTRSETRYKCCSRWGGSGCNTPYCISGLGRCPNGGTCVRPDYCNCNEHHYSPDCRPCTRISNCNEHVCKTATDQQCRRCNYDYGGEKMAYRPAMSGGRPNRICEKLCSWRSDSQQCYPGTCTAGTPASCRCAPGFNYPSSDCMSITTKPYMGFCLAKVSDGQNEFVEADCHNTSSPTVYTNQNITTLTVNWTTIYEGPSQTDYPRPYYIADYQVGVVDAKVEWSLKEVTTNVIVESGTINCNKIEGTTPDISRDRPQNHVDCDYGDDIATGIQQGQILTFKVKSLNGGFMKVKNYNNYGRVDSPQYYNGQTLIHEGTFTFDFVKPVHCAVEGDGGQACGDMLDRGPPITKNSTIVVRWSGWSDDLAGIDQYEVETFKLAPFGDKLGYRGQTPVSRQMLDGDARQAIVHATEPGVYCVLLTAIDRAGNHRVARRFLTFDDVHVVEVSTHASEAMVVTSAAQNTSHVWLTDLDGNVTTAWPGHFYNDFHRTHKFLNAIEENSPPLDPEYEERAGQLPATRSMEAVPHVHGVVGAEVLVQVDHEGGRSTANQPPAEGFTVLTDFLSEQWTIAVPGVDGDSVRVWVRARDILGNVAMDSVLVHIDSSPAVMEDVWLTRDGRRQLALHSSTDLSDMRLEFEAYDYHSGLHTLHWELHDIARPTVVHSQGNLAARTESPDNCLPPSCYCIPKGPTCFYSNYTISPYFAKMLKPERDHNFDYYIVITAINGAQLVSSIKYQLEVEECASNLMSISKATTVPQDVLFVKCTDCSFTLYVDGILTGSGNSDAGAMTFILNAIPTVIAIKITAWKDTRSVAIYTLSGITMDSTHTRKCAKEYPAHDEQLRDWTEPLYDDSADEWLPATVDDDMRIEFPENNTNHWTESYLRIYTFTRCTVNFAGGAAYAISVNGKFVAGSLDFDEAAVGVHSAKVNNVPRTIAVLSFGENTKRLILSTSSNVVSNSTWKCRGMSKEEVTGREWTLQNFDDSSWDYANEVADRDDATMGADTADLANKFDPSAKWIWDQANSAIVVCRATIG